jgi:hypothetical protein
MLTAWRKKAVEVLKRREAEALNEPPAELPWAHRHRETDANATTNATTEGK